MTDPNSEIAESADSNPDANHTLSGGESVQTKNPTADAANPPHEADSELTPEPPAGNASENIQKKEPKQKTSSHKNKKGKLKGKPKKEGDRKSTVSEKFSRSESRGFQLTADGLLRHFLACRVCCYFLSGVQVLYGREVVNRMVAEFDGTWMYVPLNRETRTLLQKTFGVRVDEGDFFIEHACEVCCRRFVIDLPEPEDFVALDTDIDDSNLEEPERREPVIFEPARTREEREPDWDQDRPMMLVEFKHRR